MTHLPTTKPCASIAFAVLCLCTWTMPAPLAAQQGTNAQDPATQASIESLRRDQDEILRKAERLRGLMDRLQTRYQREGKADQVALLQQGLAHLEQSGLLRDVASIRDDLTAAALTEAVRKQRQVVDDLEQLLNILLERKSIENIDQQVQLASERAATARELERRERLLQQQTAQSLTAEPNAAEQDLLDKLDELQRAERTEAERNARQAGTRRPFLENAQRRVEALLRQQDQLERGLADEAAGRASASRREDFDLGDLVQRARELQRGLRDQAADGQLAEAGRQLQNDAAATDQAAVQQSRERLQTKIQEAPRLPAPGGGGETVRDPEWQKLGQDLADAPAGTKPSEREALQELGKRTAELGERRAGEAGERNAAAGQRLQQDAEQLAGKLEDPAAAGATAADPNTAAAKVREAGKELATAEQATRAGDTQTAQQHVNRALGALEQARAAHQAAHPEPERQAGAMAAESASTAQELTNAPSPEAAEAAAAEQLRRAEQALRQTADEVAKAQTTDRKPDTAASAQAARQQLEQAKATLDQALAQANAGNQAEQAAAAQRQAELSQQAQQVRSQLQQAAKAGSVSPEQQQAGEQALQAAGEAMQQAQQDLERGQQANAAQRQQAASENLQKAADAVRQNRPPSAQQKQALAEQAQNQQEIADEIVKLAEELKKSDNKAAERAAQRAADAARKAQRAMEQGDSEATQEQQEEARKNLEEAAKELEEEKDRYQDQKQEELLFKMREELTQLLDKQKPITTQTREAQPAAEQGTLSRPARRKLNQLGEQEQELAARVEFLVQGLTDDGNLVYRAVLTASRDDLQEIARRLGGRTPDPGSFTTLMQQDVERRTTELLAALEREQKRRQQQKKDQQDQPQDRGKNKFSPQQQELVSAIAELEMLKQLGADTRRATEELKTLIEVGADAAISEAEIALVQRLSHRQEEIGTLFRRLKERVEGILGASDGDQANGDQPKRPH